MKKFHYYQHYFFSIFAVFLLIFLLIISIYRFIDRSKSIKDDIIYNDIISLSKILNQINEECAILGFEHNKNFIDFLNVKNFTGSEVGPMNLKYPNKWKGPYLKDNPTIQEKLYQIVKTKKGYFIVPGDGVILSNGKKIGKDIIINENSNITQMMNKEGVLMSENRPLAAKININQNKF